MLYCYYDVEKDQYCRNVRREGAEPHPQRECAGAGLLEGFCIARMGTCLGVLHENAAHAGVIGRMRECDTSINQGGTAGLPVPM